MEKKKLGGAFAWALGEDAEKFSHLKALNTALKSRDVRSDKEEL